MRARSANGKFAKSNDKPVANLDQLGGLLNQRPTIRGESNAEYDLLLSQLTEALQPSDYIESLLVRDVAIATWELLRIMRIRNRIIEHSRKEDLEEAIKEREMGSDEDNNDGPIDEEGIDALSQFETIKWLEPLDNLFGVWENRRNGILREIERRREGLARRLRAMSDGMLKRDSGDDLQALPTE